MTLPGPISPPALYTWTCARQTPVAESADCRAISLWPLDLAVQGAHQRRHGTDKRVRKPGRIEFNKLPAPLAQIPAGEPEPIGHRLGVIHQQAHLPNGRPRVPSTRNSLCGPSSPYDAWWLVRIAARNSPVKPRCKRRSHCRRGENGWGFIFSCMTTILRTQRWSPLSPICCAWCTAGSYWFWIGGVCIGRPWSCYVPAIQFGRIPQMNSSNVAATDRGNCQGTHV